MILSGGYAGPQQRARFRTEAEAAARLQHPNIVSIYEVGEQDGQPYCAMEYVAGGNLGRRLAGIPQPSRPSARLVETLARAVQYAHDHGILHRDLNPANVLLAGGPDAPLEQCLPRSPISAWPSNCRATHRGGRRAAAEPAYQTRTGEILGTPSYMAPEQAAGEAGGDRPGGRRLWPGRDPLRMPHRPAAVPGPDDAGHPGAGPQPGAGVAQPAPAPASRRPGHDLPESPGQGARPARTPPRASWPTTCGGSSTAGRSRPGPSLVRRSSGDGAGEIPVVAGLSVASGLFLAAGFLISTYFAVAENARALEARENARKAEQSRTAALRESALLALERGRNLAEQGEGGRGLLWLVRSLELADDRRGPGARPRRQDEPHRRRARPSSRSARSFRSAPSQGGCLLTPDGKTVWANSRQNKEVRPWDIATGQPGPELPLDQEGDLDPGPESQTASGSSPGPARKPGSGMSRPAGRAIRRCRHPEGVRAASFRPDGRMLATGHDRGDGLPVGRGHGAASRQAHRAPARGPGRGLQPRWQDPGNREH